MFVLTVRNKVIVVCCCCYYYWDLLHKSHNAPVPYPAMHHFVTKGAREHISVTKWCFMGYLSDGFLDCEGYIKKKGYIHRPSAWVLTTKLEIISWDVFRGMYYEKKKKYIQLLTISNTVFSWSGDIIQNGRRALVRYHATSGVVRVRGISRLFSYHRRPIQARRPPMNGYFLT